MMIMVMASYEDTYKQYISSLDSVSEPAAMHINSRHLPQIEAHELALPSLQQPVATATTATTATTASAGGSI